MEQNPYQPPQAAVADAVEDYQEVKVFSTSGRIGRLRYIAYSVGLSFLIMLVAGFLAAIVGPAGTIVTILAWGALIVVSVMLTIQRAHDFDTSGWLALLLVIPLVSLIFWFIPGTRGPNRFGGQTPPNTTGVVLGACVLPVIAIVGIIAAIALPAYSDYAKRAQQSQGKR
ncbi:MAG: DUF805 domain-containing protein [Burkholderiales bacterium]